ncbi:Hypothetical protein TPAS_2444 [Trichococcus pasteurii]|uniref:Uncharacterized protein n=1 Tax=Trichococcus pasteurii TaxID=43064 RepID=A0A1W1II67_9LACT|nr:hypothetical protein SAMN04488086_1263 [Trichococcus pasteurii]SLM52737.1 Hypothetical protein TPAS_2444 [Trichococcus pasteurii]SSB93618.1 Hypothetical protein TPAS_2444 [Trichococcus pasteurii]
MNQSTVHIVLSCIQKKCSNYPTFLIIYGILQNIYIYFEEYQMMFDHAYHNGSNYMKDNCFGGLVTNVPLEGGGKLYYLSASVGYRLLFKDEYKLLVCLKR